MKDAKSFFFALVLGLAACNPSSDNLKGPLGRARAIGVSFDGQTVGALSDREKSLRLSELGRLMLVSFQISNQSGLDPYGFTDQKRRDVVERLMRKFGVDVPSLSADFSDCLTNSFSPSSIPKAAVGTGETRTGTSKKEIYVAGSVCPVAVTGQVTGTVSETRPSKANGILSASNELKYEFSARLFPKTRLTELASAKSLTTSATLSEGESVENGQVTQHRSYNETTTILNAESAQVQFISGGESDLSGGMYRRTRSGAEALALQVGVGAKILLIQVYSEIKGYEVKTKTYLNGELIDFNPPKPQQPPPVVAPPATKPIPPAAAKPPDSPKPAEPTKAAQSLYELLTIMTKAGSSSSSSSSSSTVTVTCTGRSTATGSGKTASGTNLTATFHGWPDKGVRIGQLETDATNTTAEARSFRWVESTKADVLARLDFSRSSSGDFTVENGSSNPMNFGDGHGLVFKRDRLSVGLEINTSDFLKSPNGPWPARIWINAEGSIYLPYQGQFGKADADCKVTKGN